VSEAIRLLIVDDEPLVREALRGALAGDERIAVIGECGDGLAALEACASLQPEVVFLDVQMPALTGIEVAAQLQGEPHRPEIVFVTAYDAYAVRAFELDAIDYLLKPFDDSRVRAAVDRIVARGRRAQRPGEGEPSPALEAALRELSRRAATPLRFVTTIAGRLRVIDAATVDWMEAADNYVRLHTATGSALIRETMKSVEARLDPAEFARIHRSQIVRLSKVRELVPLESGDYRVLLTTGVTLTMSRTYRDKVLERLGG
jgi:two-component system LytT family response regulator